MDAYLGTIEDFRFITTDFLTNAALSFASSLFVKEPNFDAVIGIARSGLIPASVIACHFNLPLFSFNTRDKKLQYLSGGLRAPENPKIKRPLVVEDSYAHGYSASLIQSLRFEFPDAFIVTIFSSTFQPEGIDAFAYFYPLPHFFEWCFMNTGYSANLVVDFDGILCHEYEKINYSEEEFNEYIKNAAPLYLPRRFPVIILTARHSGNIGNSLLWLDKNNVKFLELHFWNGDPDARWKTPSTIAEWKAQKLRSIAARRHVNFYVESSPNIAQNVAYLTGIPTICPLAKMVFGWSSDKLKDIVWYKKENEKTCQESHAKQVKLLN